MGFDMARTANPLKLEKRSGEWSRQEDDYTKRLIQVSESQLAIIHPTSRLLVWSVVGGRSNGWSFDQSGDWSHCALHQEHAASKPSNLNTVNLTQFVCRGALDQ